MKIIGNNDTIFVKLDKTRLESLPNDTYLIDLNAPIPAGVDPSQCVAVSSSQETPEVITHMRTQAIDHIVGADNPNFNYEVSVASEMIESGKDFWKDPVGSILAPAGHPSDVIVVMDYEVKEGRSKSDFLKDIIEKLKKIPRSSTTIEPVTAIADELFTNLLFHAPQKAAEKKAVKPNTLGEISVPQEKSARIILAHNSDVLLICSWDTYGSLEVKKALDRIQQINDQGVRSSIRFGEGGAGIGLHVIARHASSFYMAADPGKNSLVGATILLKSSSRKRDQLQRNIHVSDGSAKKSTMAFKIKESQEGSKLILEFSGPIDEDSKFPNLEGKSFTELVFDLDGVTAINSCGSRDILKWFTTLPSQSPVTYRRIPKIFVDQINMVQGFLPKTSKIESFYVPYYCETCETVTQTVYREGIEFKQDQVKKIESIPCQNCGKDTEIDVIEVRYFRFLDRS